MPENIIGSAFIEILPNVSKFATQVQQQVASALRGVRIPPLAIGAVGAQAGGQIAAALGSTITAQLAGGTVISAARIGAGLEKAVVPVAEVVGTKAGQQGASGFVKGFSVLGGLFIARRIFQFLGEAIGQAVQFEDIGRQTAAAIASTGGAAGVTAEAVGRLAHEIENLTTLDEELVAQAENILLTFTEIRNRVGEGNDIFNQATIAVGDLATRMGGGAEGLSSAALQLGKALNAPITGLVALRRVGVQFTNEQERQIRAFVKSGDILAAQKIILGELRVEFGGSAKALGEGLGGATRRATDAIGDFTRSLAESLSPAIKGISVLVSGLFNFLADLPAPIKAATGALVGFVGVGVGLGALSIAIKNLSASMGSLIASVPLLKAIRGFSIGTAGAGLLGIAGSLSAIAAGTASLGLLATGIGVVAVGAGVGLEKLVNHFNRSHEGLEQLVGDLRGGKITFDEFNRAVGDINAPAKLRDAILALGLEIVKEIEAVEKAKDVHLGLGAAVDTAVESFRGAAEEVKAFTEILDATVGIQVDVARAQNSIQDAVTKLKTGLRDGTRSFEGFTDAARTNRENLLGLVERINALNIALVATGEIDKRQALAITTLAIQNLIRTVPGAGAVLGGLVTQAGRAALAMLTFAASIEAAQNAFRLLAGLPPVFVAANAFNAVSDAADALNDTIKLTPPALDKTGASLSKTGGALDKVKEKIHPLIAAFTKLKDATSLFNQFLDATTGKVLNQLTATANFQEAIDALGQSLLDNGATFNATTEQGRSNINALVSAVQAAQAEVAALVEAGKIKPTTGAEKAALETRIESLKRTFPEAAALIDRILAQLDKIPGKAKVGPIIKFQVDTKIAEKARKELAKDIEAHVIFKFFKLTPGGVIPVQITTRQMGGFLGAGQTALVGEQGPELITPRQPVQVHSNTVLTRLLAAMERIGVRGERGPAVGQINVLAGRTPIETAIEIARRLRAEQFLSTGSF